MKRTGCLIKSLISFKLTSKSHEINRLPVLLGLVLGSNSVNIFKRAKRKKVTFFTRSAELSINRLCQAGSDLE